MNGVLLFNTGSEIKLLVILIICLREGGVWKMATEEEETTKAGVNAVLKRGYYNYEFIKSRKGPLKLLHQGYEYISSVSGRTQPLRLWRCCRYMYHQQVCGASAILEAGGKLSLLGVHNHLPAKLLHKGYEYLFEEMDKYNQRKLYRCHRYLSPDTPCMAKAVVTDKGDLTLIGSHDHPPDKSV